MSLPETTEDLAPQQYGDIYGEHDVPLTDVRRSGLRLVLYGGAGLLVLFVVLASVITIPRHLRFPFVLKGSTKERIYRYPDDVYIDTLYVSAGEPVRRGQPLLRIASPGITAMIAAYDAAVRGREVFERGESATYDAKIEEAHLREQHIGVEIAEVEAERSYGAAKGQSELRALTADADNARKVLESQRQLHAAGSTADLELSGAQTRYIEASERLRAAETRLEGEGHALANKARQLALERDMTARTVAALDAERAGRRQALDGDVDAAARAIEMNYGPFRVGGGSLELLSPAAGVVSFVFDGERALSPGTVLLKLKEGDSGLYAAALVPSDLIGFVRYGEAAALEVSTFPHYHWGSVKGAVASVSLTPDEKGGYPLRVAINDRGKLGGRLGAGMTGEMSVAVEERTLFAILFEKIDDAMD